MSPSFEQFRAESGAWSARHIKSGILLHSATDPVREGESIAAQLISSVNRDVLLIGAGLGYLEEELRRRGVTVRVVEPFSEVARMRIGMSVGQDATPMYEKLEDTIDLLEHYCRTGSSPTVIYVAPYVRALLSEVSPALRSRLEEYVVLKNSREEYAPLIHRNFDKNRSSVAKLPALSDQVLRRSEFAVACGAGPSLAGAVNSLRRARPRFQIVACNSAVPFLRENQVHPDWCVALEAHEGVAESLADIDHDSRVVVFPWTDPAVFEMSNLKLYVANTRDISLESHGGTTLLSAVDLAARIAKRAVCILGGDLSWSNGQLVEMQGSRTNSNPLPKPLKFDYMRKHMESWIAGRPDLEVLHVIENQDLLLKGAIHVHPSKFVEVVTVESSLKCRKAMHDFTR